MTYTVKQIMERYSVAEGTVSGWCRSGELRAINVGTTAGKKIPRLRITEQALADFEASRAIVPPAPRSQRRKPKDATVRFYK